ncbi:hypothetical protein [Actinomycetospora atypica]|uniref:DUF6841 domain-containing protein n=1 Tax=Actinomycetospora atypica TaxID=1290095 RepID=A0ABV9YWJ7_9PSEU
MDVAGWFDRYVAAFVALCRGDRDDAEALLEYYSVPLLITGDADSSWFGTADEVLAVARGQMAAMRDAGFDRTEMSGAQAVALNRTSTWFAADFVRRRGDDSEIAAFSAFYLITDLPVGRRITTLGIRS